MLSIPARRILARCSVAILLIAAMGACNGAQAEAERNKEIVRTFWQKVFNEGDLDLIDELIAPNYTLNGHPSPPEATKNWVKGLRAAAPDLKFTILDLVAEGDKVAVRWELDVTAPNGLPMRNTGTNVLTIRHGRAISNWQTGGAPADMAPAVATAGLIRATAFRNSVNPPPRNFESLFGLAPFELSDEYPDAAPDACDPDSTCKWLAREVSFDDPDPGWAEWARYMQDIKVYILEGNDIASGKWNVQVGGSPRWYHMPWQAANPESGREFVHGMTQERTAHIVDLLGGKETVAGANPPAPTDPGFQTWAFGVYNEWGGYSIGQLIPTSGVPKFPTSAGLPFPEGTVAAKLLFTTATDDEVPYLRGSPQWMINRHLLINNAWVKARRGLDTVRLVQFDVAVRDDRSPTGWVFGTFVYNNNQPGARSLLDRIVPLGIQFGNDPEVQPAVPESTAKPIQSVLNALDIFEHVGCQGRLAGPVDTSSSSCVSCHAAAYAADVPNAFGVGAIPNMMPPTVCTKNEDGKWLDQSTQTEYFQNRRFGEPYSDRYPESQSLDFSLQLSGAYFNYDRFMQSFGPLTDSPPQ